jgi:hypothetical protein
VRVRVPDAHTSAGTFRICAESEVDAFVTSEPTELDAASTALFVFALIAVWLAEIAELSDEVAVWTSDSVAREPDESPAPVRVRVPFAHTSEARVPNVVSERVPAAHTAVGTFVIDEASTVRVEPSEVDAVRIWRLVFVFIFDASDVDAARTVEFVFELTAVWLALIAELREDDAVCTSESVASEPEVRPAPVSVRVP